MTVAVRFRDAFRKYIPPWLADRRTLGVGTSAGFRYLWSMIAPLDAAIEVLVQGLQAPWPGLGTSTALPLIARTRGLIRGESESDASFSARLVTWLDKWRAAGSAEAIASAIKDYCANHPRVRIITRSGKWVTLNQDGSIVRTTAAWNWDGTSHPENAGFWSELWVIVYGNFAKTLWPELHRTPKFYVAILVTFADERPDGEFVRWTILLQVVAALEELGWVKRR